MGELLTHDNLLIKSELLLDSKSWIDQIPLTELHKPNNQNHRTGTSAKMSDLGSISNRDYPIAGRGRIALHDSRIIRDVPRW